MLSKALATMLVMGAVGFAGYSYVGHHGGCHSCCGSVPVSASMESCGGCPVSDSCCEKASSCCEDEESCPLKASEFVGPVQPK